MLEKFIKDCLPSKGFYTGTVCEECEEEGAAEAMCNDLTTIFIPIPLCCLGEGSREAVSEGEYGKKEEVGRTCFQFWVYFSMSYSDLIGGKFT